MTDVEFPTKIGHINANIVASELESSTTNLENIFLRLCS